MEVASYFYYRSSFFVSFLATSAAFVLYILYALNILYAVMILASVIMLIFQIWSGVVFFSSLCALIDVLWLCDCDDAQAMAAWVA